MVGEESNRLFAAAIEKYAEALRLKPDYAHAWSNWGATLIHQSQLLPAGNQSATLAQASGHLQKAVELGAAEAAFNLACIAAIQRNAIKSLEWLKHAQDGGYPMTQKQIVDESDLKRSATIQTLQPSRPPSLNA